MSTCAELIADSTSDSAVSARRAGARGPGARDDLRQVVEHVGDVDLRRQVLCRHSADVRRADDVRVGQPGLGVDSERATARRWHRSRRARTWAWRSPAARRTCRRCRRRACCSTASKPSFAVDPAIETVAARSVEIWLPALRSNGPETSSVIGLDPSCAMPSSLSVTRERDLAGVDRVAGREALRDERRRRCLDGRGLRGVPAAATGRDRGGGANREGNRGEASKLEPGCPAGAIHDH